MNPYLLINIDIPPLTYHYRHVILKSEWPETIPTSETEPVLTAEISLDKWQNDSISAIPEALGTLRLFFDRQPSPLSYLVRTTLLNNGGLIKYTGPSQSIDWHIFNLLRESNFHWIWEGRRQDLNQTAELIINTLKNWQPLIEDTPTGRRLLNWSLLYSSTEAGLQDKQSQPATITFDPYASHPNLDPARKYKSGFVTIGYGLFKDNAVFAVEPAGVFLRSEIFQTPEESVQTALEVSIYGQKQDIAAAAWRREGDPNLLPIIPTEDYQNHLIDDLKNRINLLTKGFNFRKKFDFGDANLV